MRLVYYSNTSEKPNTTILISKKTLTDGERFFVSLQAAVTGYLKWPMRPGSSERYTWPSFTK